MASDAMQPTQPTQQTVAMDAVAVELDAVAARLQALTAELRAAVHGLDEVTDDDRAE